MHLYNVFILRNQKKVFDFFNHKNAFESSATRFHVQEPASLKKRKRYLQTSNISSTKSSTLMFFISSFSCLCPIHYSKVLSREWRCSWSSANRRCSNYIWVMNNLIAYKGMSYIRGLTIFINKMSHITVKLRTPVSVTKTFHTFLYFYNPRLKSGK